MILPSAASRGALIIPATPESTATNAVSYTTPRDTIFPGVSFLRECVAAFLNDTTGLSHGISGFARHRCASVFSKHVRQKNKDCSNSGGATLILSEAWGRQILELHSKNLRVRHALGTVV